MNVSKLDVCSLGMKSLFGAILGLTFGITQLYTSRRTGDSVGYDGSLNMDTLALHQDSLLKAYTMELKRRTTHERLFYEMLNRADQIVLLHSNVSQRRATQDDYKCANRLHNETRDRLKQLKEQFSTMHSDSKELIADYDKLLNDIASHLEKYYVLPIIRLCRRQN